MILTQEKIEEWLNCKASLDAAKKVEKELRILICEALSDDKEEGTHRYTIAGYELKSKVSYNYKLDPEVANAVLTKEEAACISSKPMLSLAPYRELEYSELIDEYIIVTPAMPTLTISWESE
ncbi:MAG: hypothetical protein V3R78_12500 [Thermodesulfobacteriota bacterium]